MEVKIGNALKSIGLPLYYVQPGTEKAQEYIVFNYSFYPCNYADNVQLGNKYTILINLFSKSVNTYKKEIIDAMLDNGFTQGNIEPTQIERIDNGSVIYNTAFVFRKYERR